MNIGLKGTKTMEILSNMNSQEIEIQLADPSRAALIVPSEQPEGMDILMLQMPMLLND
jgi:DNA polymerase-3 subunit beta